MRASKHRNRVGAVIPAVVALVFVAMAVRHQEPGSGVLAHISGVRQTLGHAHTPPGHAAQPAGRGRQPAGHAAQPAGHGRQPVAQARQPQPLGVPGHWRLVLDSRFNGRHPDPRIWRTGWFRNGVSGPINQHEAACYSPANVAPTGHGAMRLIVVRKRSRCGHRRRLFTGAVLSSNPRDGRAHGGFSYRYGLLQAKIYVPGDGAHLANWPAVLSLGQVWPRDGEDDVMENLGGVVCSHFHSPGYAPGGNLGGCDPGFTPGWHVVSANWEPGSVTWYYDGVQIAQATKGITGAPMYIVVVNSVSTKALQVARPAAVRLVYVRVWQRVPPPAPPRPKHGRHQHG